MSSIIARQHLQCNWHFNVQAILINLVSFRVYCITVLCPASSVSGENEKQRLKLFPEKQRLRVANVFIQEVTCVMYIVFQHLFHVCGVT